MPLPQDELELFRSARGAVVAVGTDDLIAYASTEALALLGWDEGLVGRPLTVIIPERLRARHREGFARYAKTGESRLHGKTVRVPALCKDGRERDLDLTIRVFRRPDGTRLVSAGLSQAPLGHSPRGLVLIEDALQKRLYQLI
ncbi:MAG TPA: PAS domain S-box protein [Candidatus Thermoplasmatota archaeon]|nr:PAS domain S-box protein [Candidatus Thermoplasmatota archaeon]